MIAWLQRAARWACSLLVALAVVVALWFTWPDPAIEFMVRLASHLLLGATATLLVARHWRRAVGLGMRLRAAPPARSSVTMAAHAAPSDCPFCRSQVASADLTAGVVRCPTCEVAHHGECWKEHGGCATLACGRSPQEREKARERVTGA